MLFPKIQDLIAALQPGQRLLGIDPGRKLIGVALSDVERRFASPLRTITRAKLSANATEFASIVAKEGVGGLVIGCPYEIDGGLGRSGQAAKDWGRSLSDMLKLPGCLWDESLTTSDVESFMTDQADLSRAKRLQVKDRAAAALILQQAMDEARR